ncbi:unnamed protein product [Owenia fusiformis]|uniref:Serpin domain-containing protein n=1 Tax=Owenia fusiformis TaxID=6347 RepID=A0A8S4N7T8_OWEFU|nr:unnamed protein product [Owenia fusiformis]
MLRVLVVLVYMVTYGGTTGDRTPLGNSINAFALDLYNELLGCMNDSVNDSMVISPFSISTAFGMAYLGAAGDTATQIARVLKYPTNVHEQFEALLTNIAFSDENYKLNAANNVFPLTGLEIRPQYVSDVLQFYLAAIKELDFQKYPEESRQYINEWVSNKTMEKIPELLHRGDVNSGTVLVLVNAIYFKGDWLTQFNPNVTSIVDFYVSPLQRISVDMMHSQDIYRYIEDPVLDAQVLQLPYTGEEVSMIVILPKNQNGLPDLEASLTTSNLDEAIAKLYAPYSSILVDVHLP